MKKLFALVAACGLGLSAIGCGEAPKPAEPAKPAETPKTDGTTPAPMPEGGATPAPAEGGATPAPATPGEPAKAP